MPDNNSSSRQRTKAIISLVASVILGLTFIAAGSGKVIGFGEVPGQTIEFIGDILPDAFITPTTVFILFEIFIPYVLPGLELLLGILLLVGLVPRLIAVLYIPLTLAFISNNIWAISQGMDKFPECVCFGIWERILGGLTPVQALVYDILLLILAIVIILIYPGGFLSSRDWLTRLMKKKSAED